MLNSINVIKGKKRACVFKILDSKGTKIINTEEIKRMWIDT